MLDFDTPFQIFLDLLLELQISVAVAARQTQVQARARKIWCYCDLPTNVCGHRTLPSRSTTFGAHLTGRCLTTQQSLFKASVSLVHSGLPDACPNITEGADPRLTSLLVLSAHEVPPGKVLGTALHCRKPDTQNPSCRRLGFAEFEVVQVIQLTYPYHLLLRCPNLPQAAVQILPTIAKAVWH